MASIYDGHQMGSVAILTVHYWVEGATNHRIHNVAMVGSCHSYGMSDKVEALVLSETGNLYPISAYMKNIDATMFKIVGIAQPSERTR